MGLLVGLEKLINNPSEFERKTMTSGNDGRFLVREFKVVLEKAKSDALLFAILTVLLTPFLLLALVAAFIFALAFVDLPVIDHLGFARSFLTGANLTVGFMLASYFLNPKPSWQRKSKDEAWTFIAIALFCGLLMLSYTTPLNTTHRFWFWAAYPLLAFGSFACIGHAYEPHDDYYLGWGVGPVLYDDPFTFRDDIDRAHLCLGFLASISHMILESYAAIFGSTWLWRSLDDSQLHEAVAFLREIDSNDPKRAQERIYELSRRSALDLIRALVKLEMVVVDREKIRLSPKGREFLGRVA